MMAAAARANAGAQLSIAAQARKRFAEHDRIPKIERILAAQDERILLLEAIVHGLSIRLDRVDDVSSYAADLGESAERRLSA